MGAKFRHHKYDWSRPFGSPRHQWSFIGPLGGVQFVVNLTTGYPTTCGLEFHHSRAAGYRVDEAPDHIDCWLLKEPCWHDGTSLYASESLWPRIEPMLRAGDHESIFCLLEIEYDERFAMLAAREGK